MSISSNIQLALYSDSAITALLKSWVYSSTTYYAIFAQSLLPKEITTDSSDLKLGVRDATINHYQAIPISGALPYIDTTYTISCRAYTESKALAIQSACFNALNRVKSADGKNHFVCTTNPVISPRDDNDNYNAVVEVRARGKLCL
jgi:hypothetical protein